MKSSKARGPCSSHSLPSLLLAAGVGGGVGAGIRVARPEARALHTHSLPSLLSRGWGGGCSSPACVCVCVGGAHGGE